MFEKDSAHKQCTFCVQFKTVLLNSVFGQIGILNSSLLSCTCQKSRGSYGGTQLVHLFALLRLSCATACAPPLSQLAAERYSR